jgi:uncharacterized repeat protein (TIGR01451 family)
MSTIKRFLLLVPFVLLLVPSNAFAEEATPQWTVTAISSPTNFNPTAKPGEDSYQVTVTNTGSASSSGPVEITDQLPGGLALDSAGASGENLLDQQFPHAGFSCVLRTCVYSGVVVPDQTLLLTFPVDVGSGAEALSPLSNVVTVSGGGAAVASMPTLTVVSKSAAVFGLSPGGLTTALSSEQAGAHPDITTSIAFNTVDAHGTLAAYTKDLTDVLPAGFAADFVDTPSCSGAQFLQLACPVASQVGVTTVILKGGTGSGRLLEPVYDLTPNAGEIAKIGFSTGSGSSVEAGISLLGDYRSATVFSNINETYAPIVNASLTIWGVPASSIHDPLRLKPRGQQGGGHIEFGAHSEAAPVPFFTNATSCGSEPLRAEVTIDSWEAPSNQVEEGIPFGPMVGCDHLAIEPSLTAEVSTNKASAPTGFDLATSIPQTYDNAAGLATSTLKKEVVTLPEGMTVNPSAGAGLAGCSPAQYAEEGAQFLPGRGCPSESKLGTVKVTTPALKEEVTGSVFLAQPYDNLPEFGDPSHPFGSLLALYVVGRIPARGVLVKFAGKVEPDLQTGRLLATFDNLPPLPFSLATFSFIQGPSSPLVSPPVCGQYTVQAQLTPYSDPAGPPFSPPIPPFSITQGFDGGACPTGGVPPFKPQVIAGTQNNEAGAYSPLGLLVTRNDGEQEITRFSSQLPPGLTANLSGVPFCSDANIELAKRKTGAQEEAEPSCPSASEIGQTLAGAGVGSVLAVARGKVYMAGPYNGAPFSIVAITSAKVGPFDLGTVVVREALEIDPQTAVVTVDAKASDPIPHIIDGIVIHVREIRVSVDRPDFTLNPTNCAPMDFSATVNGSGADPSNPTDEVPVTVSAPFRVTACQALTFKPAFKVTTSGKTSRSKGASLTAKLTYPKAPFGSQANIARVKVDLPKQLPSRLTTLQKACTAAQFNANPAGCPAASFIGHAKAITPILPVPLEGPAIFVSHGGEAFPSLIVVLQGYGVTIDLVGSTFISKAGITSSTFKTVPDQPVTSFELTLPEGKYSALAANGNLCAVTKSVTVSKRVTRRVHGRTRRVTVKVKKSVAAPLAMPTEFVAQNGAVIHQSTPITVTGCAKSKPAKKKAKGKVRKRAKKK